MIQTVTENSSNVDNHNINKNFNEDSCNNNDDNDCQPPQVNDDYAVTVQNMNTSYTTTACR